MKNSLAEVHPELVSEWSEKNDPLTPETITYGSNKIVWWHGKCGHEWQTSVKSRSAGEGCPICSGARVVAGINDLATLRPDLAEEWSDKNGELHPDMVSLYSHKKVIWKGKCGHEWKAVIKSRTLNKTGCPYCSHNLLLPGYNDLQALFPDVAEEWSERNKPLLPNHVAAFANKKVWWKCRSCGNEWNTLISTRAYGSKCPYCSGLVLLKGFNDFKTRYPELAAEWSDKNLPLKPDMVNEKSRKNVWWKCRTCGYEWKSVIYTRVHGSKCPVCAQRAVMPGYNDLASTDPHLLVDWDYNKNTKISPKHITRNSMQSVWWHCECGHEWKARICDRAIDGVTCRICDEEYRMAFPALFIGLYARKAKTAVKVKSTQEIGIALDFYLPDERIALEVNEEQKKLDSVKQHLCSSNGIKLIKLPLEKEESDEDYARKVVAVFRSVHIFIRTDIKEDAELIRNSFKRWRRGQSA